MILQGETPHFQMNLNYNGQSQHSNPIAIPDLINIERRVKKIESLDKPEMNQCNFTFKVVLSDLKSTKNSLDASNKQIYGSINRYGNQINMYFYIILVSSTLLKKK